MPRATDHFSAHADELIPRYESVSFEEIHQAWLDLLPAQGGLALDIGAGSGRDAAALADRGFEVVAVEPSAEMRRRARDLHPSARICWLADALPDLRTTVRQDYRFDVILLSGVWQLIPPKQRPRAIRKLAGLLRPGGLLVISLRLGPVDRSRGMHPVLPQELHHLARRHALEVVPLAHSDRRDILGRPDVHWTTAVLRSPDDGTGALPLLRHIVLQDAKSSTYKLALLRVLLRIADGSRGMVLDRDGGFVTLPLGLVGLYWLRAFAPLLLTPETPFRQVGKNTGLGFVKAPFRALSAVSPYDLTVGSRFGIPASASILAALRDACNTIRKMPAHYTTFPGTEDPVFEVRAGHCRSSHRGKSVLLDRDLLNAFGQFRVPLHIWQALSSYACWIEPAVVQEWADLMSAYDRKQGITRSKDDYLRALQWLDPKRRTREVRTLADELLSRGHPLHCTWTGRRLRTSRFEVDHCLPFACWPNNDLWNLLPTSPTANRAKSDRLPSADTLHSAHDRLLTWWGILAVDVRFRERFFWEASAALPGARPEQTVIGHRSEELAPVAEAPALSYGGAAEDLQTLFVALNRQRIRLRIDQRIAEWSIKSEAAGQ